MFYDLTFLFPKEKYSIEKSNNKLLAKDKEGNRFIMNANYGLADEERVGNGRFFAL